MRRKVEKGFCVSLILLILCSAQGRAWGGVYSETAHGNRLTGVERDGALPKGACGQCHVDKEDKGKYPHALWHANDNDLCYTCHNAVDLTGLFPGRELYDRSSHNTDPRFVWPGPFPPARRATDMAGKCLNCHNPHGKQDNAGLIPSLLIARQVTLCLSCHDGDPSTRDIARDIRKPYSHQGRFGTHGADEAASGDSVAFAGGNRHVECSDCHNPHAVVGDPMPPIAPVASTNLARVSRVSVMNGFAGTIPRYVFLPANDTSTPALEYEICYKCHSSWAWQPPGQQDIALLLNTNNASFHPVEAPGKNPSISPAAFVNGMTGFSTITCSDCHGSDDSNLRGPHGSLFPNILKGAYEAGSSNWISTRTDLCFNCHNFATYADPFSAQFEQDASRFNKHAVHIGQHNIPCYACHESHGSPQYGGLIAIGRTPGIRSFTMTPAGATCLPTCHDSRSYSVPYSR